MMTLKVLNLEAFTVFVCSISAESTVSASTNNQISDADD